MSSTVTQDNLTRRHSDIACGSQATAGEPENRLAESSRTGTPILPDVRTRAESTETVPALRVDERLAEGRINEEQAFVSSLLVRSGNMSLLSEEPTYVVIYSSRRELQP